MKRQIAKGLTMLMLVVGLAFAAASVANGQTGRQVTADIPFDFVIADKTLHSGQYQVVKQTQAGEALNIRRVDGKDAMIRLTSNAGETRDMRTKLVFHRY